MISKVILIILVTAAVLGGIYYLSTLAVKLYHFIKRESDEDYRIRRKALKELQATKDDIEDIEERIVRQIKKVKKEN